MPSCQRRGFALPSAIFLLVILAALGIFIVRINMLQTSSLTLDALGTNAYQAARAGVEWGAYQVLQGANKRPASCFGDTNLTFAGTALASFTATVHCEPTTVDELGVITRIDKITATACNQPTGGGVCPQPAPGANYAERQITIVVGQ